MLIPRSTLQFRFIPGVLLAVGVATTAPRAVAAPLFTARFLSFDTGDSPTSVAIGDVNADGNLDLVVANSGLFTGGSGHTVSVLLGNGDGGVGAKTDYETGNGPRSVAIGDLNRDGKPDLAVTNSGSSTV